MKKIGVIGLGNKLRQDDGIGIILLEKLEQQKNLFPKNVTLINAGIPGINLIHIVEPFDEIIFLDAVNLNKKPGISFFFKPEEVSSQKNNNSVSIHETDVLKIINIYKKIKQDDKQFYIFGVQPKKLEYGENLTIEIRNNLEKIIKKLTDIINELSKK